MRRGRGRRLLISVLAAVGLMEGCILGSAPFEHPTSNDLPGLERRLAADATDVEAGVALSVTALSEGRYAEARVLLEDLVDRLPGDPALPVLLGIADQELGDVQAARNRYVAYRESHGGGPLVEHSQIRLDMVEAAALREDVRALLAREGSPAAPRVTTRVLVLPFARSGDDAQAEAESTALTALLTAHLRTRSWLPADDRFVRLLLDEMDLPPARLGELSVGLRLARLTTAGHVVQMRSTSLVPDSVRWDVTVTGVAADGGLSIEHLALVGDAQRTLEMEQRMASMLLEVMGPASEADEAAESHTGSIDALRLFGRGVLALDRGETSEALEAFERARAIDPDFEEAGALVRRLQAVLALEERPLDAELVEVARVGERIRAVALLGSVQGGGQERALENVGRRDRAVIPEVLGLTRLSGGVILDAVFSPPGGGGS